MDEREQLLAQYFKKEIEYNENKSKTDTGNLY
jgi:hypothetical protein